MKTTLLGWTLPQFATAVEAYRTETGKGPLSNLSEALDVQAHWVITRGTADVEPDASADLGWARALFSKTNMALEESGALTAIGEPRG